MMVVTCPRHVCPQLPWRSLKRGGGIVRTGRADSPGWCLFERHLGRVYRANPVSRPRVHDARSDTIVSDPDIMRGLPVYRGTRIPVRLVADMLSQGATPEEILEGYPSLDKEKIALAPFYVQAFPRRGRPLAKPWAKAKPIRATRHRRSLEGRH